ncbi:MAG: hypothetical protein E6Q88_11345 [Lysobacteraceae bacterium]|nr:MAG: hypothetical protein E6Q88_11345 [Xanthomonadaceae bacterium]
MRGSIEVAEQIADLMMRGQTSQALKLLMAVDGDQGRNDMLDAVGRIFDRVTVEKQRSGKVGIHKAALDALRSERLLSGVRVHAVNSGDRNSAWIWFWALLLVAALVGMAWYSSR